MICRDRSCDPSKGEAGCMASTVNEGAVDALDFVWVRAWDDCPVLRQIEELADAERHVQSQEDAAYAAQERYLEATGDLP